MLFSAWQAMTQALQPMHVLRSIAMPHLWPSYETGSCPQVRERRVVDHVFGEVGLLLELVERASRGPAAAGALAMPVVPDLVDRVEVLRAAPDAVPRPVARDAQRRAATERRVGCVRSG